MLDETKPDLVAVITPGPLHAPQSIAALEAGAHVLVETPNVYSADQAREIRPGAGDRRPRARARPEVHAG